MEGSAGATPAGEVASVAMGDGAADGGPTVAGSGAAGVGVSAGIGAWVGVGVGVSAGIGVCVGVIVGAVDWSGDGILVGVGATVD